MIERILEPENLAAAWTAPPRQRPFHNSEALPQSPPARRDKRVKANKGAPGIDGMTVGDFPAFARDNWPRIAKAIGEGV